MKFPSKFEWTRRRIILAIVVVGVGIAAPLSWWTFHYKTAVAQSPMGDRETEVQADNGGPPTTAAPTAAQKEMARTAFGATASASQACLARLQSRLDSVAVAQAQDSTHKPLEGRNAAEAKKHGWFPKMPQFSDGSILPCSRIVAYYGHPGAKRMGVLGEYPKDEMLRRFKAQLAEWRAADPTTPVVPALQMIAVVAQGDPGTSGKYRTITQDSQVQAVYDWAKEIDGIYIIDIQVGQDDIRNILPRFEWILKNPDVHLAVDPEFYMHDGVVPGRKIGSMSAADVNYISQYLAGIVHKYNLPPKVLVIHRFTRPMLKNYKDIVLRPEVEYVSDMDGYGAEWLKADSYHDYIMEEPIQFTGFKGFYHNDTVKGRHLLTPVQFLQFHPVPLYIQYQ